MGAIAWWQAYPAHLTPFKGGRMDSAVRGGSYVIWLRMSGDAYFVEWFWVASVNVVEIAGGLEAAAASDAGGSV